MRKADDGSPALVDLMKNIIAEKLDNVSIPSLAPSWVSREPARFRVLSREIMLGGFVTHSGRSLIKPNLASRRTRRAFSSSDISSPSRWSMPLCRRGKLELEWTCRKSRAVIAYFCRSSISVRSLEPIISNS
jgi:hypothetical protein